MGSAIGNLIAGLVTRYMPESETVEAAMTNSVQLFGAVAASHRLRASVHRVSRPIKKMCVGIKLARQQDLSHGPREIQTEAQLHIDARALRRREARRRTCEEGQAGERAVLLRAEAPRQSPALRLPARAQGRAAVVGGAEGTVAESEDKAARDARRGSPDSSTGRSKASSPKATAPAS